MIPTESPIIKRLNGLLKEKDLTANRVAVLGGIRQSSVSDILTGRTANPRLDTLTAIARGLNMSLTELLDFSPYNERPDGSSPAKDQSKWDKLGNILTSDEKRKVFEALTGESL